VTREFNGVGWMVGVESGEDSTASCLSNVLVDVVKGGGHDNEFPQNSVQGARTRPNLVAFASLVFTVRHRSNIVMSGLFV
jgi:hypothetical protein